MTKQAGGEVARMVESGELVATDAVIDTVRMPPVLADRETKAVARQVERFYLSIAEIFEMWVRRRRSPHTQRAYRQDVMTLTKHLGIDWPRMAPAMLQVSVGDMMSFRDSLEAAGSAPKTINRRISSVSSFYKYLSMVAAELRLPIVVPNPAHAQFIGRASTDAVDETKDLSATKARQLMAMPDGEELVALRDRAILKTFLYTGARVDTVCKLKVSDFHADVEDPTLRLTEKGDKRRTIGLNQVAADAIGEYLAAGQIDRGALFRPRAGSRSKELAPRAMTTKAMHNLVLGYLKQLPGAKRLSDDGRELCVYSPHSLRATTATLLLDGGTDIRDVQKLLGHRHVTTTQVYDKRRRSTKQSASHAVLF